MADVKKTVEVLFKATDDMSGVMSSIGGRMSAFSGSVQSATQPLADITKSIAKLDVALGLLVAGGLALTIKAAGDFGDSFAEISTLIDDTGQDVHTFEKDILSYATNSTASIDDINKSIYTAISAGTDYKDSLDLLTQSEQLSVAGKADLEATTRVLVSSLNAYGESVDQAQNFSDALFTTVKVGQTTLPELANSLAQVSTIAAQGGVKFDELMAAIAAVTATGAPTTQAITSIKAAIAAIIKPSSEATKEAAKLGIQFDASALATKGLDGVLKDVYTATGGATDQITKLFGSVESLPAVLTLGADTSGRFKDALVEMANKTGATEEAFLKMAGNMTLANQNLANNVRVVLIATGAKVLDEYSDLAGSVADVFKALGTSINAGDFDQIIAVIEGVMSRTSETLEGIAEALPEALEGLDWSNLITSLEGLGGSIGDIFKDLFGDLDLTKADDLEKVLQTIVDGIAELVKVTTGIVQGLGPFIEMLGDMIEKFREMSPDDIAETAGEILGFGTALNVVAGMGSAVGGVLTAVGGALNTIALVKLSGVTAGMTGLTGTLPALTSLSAGLTGAIGTASLGSSAGFLGLAAAAGWATGKILNAHVPAITTASQALLGWVDSIVNFTGTQKSANQVLAEEEAYLKAVETATNRSKGALDNLDGTEVDIDVETRSFESNLAKVNAKMKVWEGEEAQKKIDFEYKEALKALTVDIQAELDAEPVEMSAGMDPDAFGDIEDFMGEIETELKKDRIEFGVEPDDKSLDDAVRQVKKSFSFASMGPVNIPISIDSNSMGPATDAMGNHFKENPIPMEDIFDPSGIADLIEAASGAERVADRKRLIDQTMKMMDSQRRAIDAETSNINARRAIAELEWRRAQMDKSSSEMASVIEIEAHGVEPEIEAFMFKILKKIQIRCSESGAEFLLAAAS